ncbi:Cdc15p [Rhizophagus irregularis DAOM 197198w]|uniref:Cdc15p n=1 Tax=Rhizophagus irregularis (strain DAOM 197198w) TaxID=1432141 RepID=A0A015MI40_RHIIW|nr:Cdc15p [Rhizophagus irregularis DAOM 197198w]
MQNNENINEWIIWIEEAINKKHIKYYEFENFKNIQEIGSGTFGKVFRANWKNFDHYLALKSFFNLNSITLKEIVNELKFQRDVYFHNNIIRFYGITKLESSTENIFNPTKGYLLVVEYTDSGTLREYLKNNFHRFTWNDKYNLAYQLACSVLCLHEEGIVHRDLHSSNVLIHQGSIKLADFGLSKRINDASKSQSKLLGMIPYIDPKKLVDNNLRSNEKCDEYDFSLMYKISQGRREITVPNTPNDYSNLYTECWNNEPSKRPSIHEVVNRLRTSNRITIYQQNDISDKTSPMPNENKTPIRELSNIDTTSEIDRMSTNEQNKQLVENLENSLGENENLREKLQILQKGNTELIELNKTLRSQLDETTAQLECARPSVYQGNKDIDAVMENDKKVRSLLESRMVDLMAKKNKFMCF